MIMSTEQREQTSAVLAMRYGLRITYRAVNDEGDCSAMASSYEAALRLALVLLQSGVWSSPFMVEKCYSLMATEPVS
jgi:hypothetical protein